MADLSLPSASRPPLPNPRPIARYPEDSPEFELQTVVSFALPTAMHGFNDNWRSRADALIERLAAEGWEIRRIGPPAAELRTVLIPGSDSHDGQHAIQVTIPWVCQFPGCGKPRGDVHRGISYDGSRRLEVDTWTNPCGHVDYYSAVRRQAADLAAGGTS